MKGMNANTGRSISGLNHFYQSIGKIVTTPLASCEPSCSGDAAAAAA